MENEYFEITNEAGDTILCERLLTFKENNQNYIIYTDFETDDLDNIRILAATYKIENANYILNSIETEEEWKIINKKWEEHQND